MSKIAFFGTPEFAVASLLKTHEFCVASGHELILVVTQPDRPQGRGQKVLPSKVKAIAQNLGIAIAQPETLKKGTKEGDNFYEIFKKLNIELAIVVAYGAIITKRLLESPTCGFVNIHASLLPKHRGAAPVQRAIMSGDKVSGVCLMKMSEKLDEGDIFACLSTPILPFDTGFSLSLRLSHLGAHLLKENLLKLLLKKLSYTPQPNNGISYAQKLSKDEGLLNFNSSGAFLNQKVRALDPWPSAYAFVHGKRVKFFNSFFVPMMLKEAIRPGTVMSIRPNIGINCLDGVIFFEAVQIEGRGMQKGFEAAQSLMLEVGDVIYSE